MRQIFSGVVLLALMFALAACSVAVVTVKVAVTPSTVTLAAGASQQFTATVTNASTGETDVTWTTTGGAIIGSGNTITYTAPSTPGTYTVTATSVSFPDVSDTATVTVAAPPLEISNLAVTTNHQDSTGDYYICTNQLTTLAYAFKFTGNLQSWNQLMMYQDFENNTFQGNAATLPQDDPNHTSIGNGSAAYAFTVSVPGGLTSSSQEIGTQSILTQIGTAHLNINAGGSATLNSSELKVYNNCS